MKSCKLALLLFPAALIFSCSKSSNDDDYTAITEKYPETKAVFGTSIDLENLENYANQTVPAYITRNNSAGNPVSDKAATLGRILFYDKNLSSNNTIACASCHLQSHAFSDPNTASNGVNGTTGRHSMRLINVRFANEAKFFWNERAANLETQTTMPIKDHGEMGFSGENGDQPFSGLLTRLGNIGYYKELFTFVYGSEEVTEVKLQNALANFIRSIQSFDSRYDLGRLTAPNDGQPFANFTQQENMGKNLFLQPAVFNQMGVRTGGGFGCAGCHAPPEFDIDPNTRNNGLISSLAGGTDITNTRAPSLRDLLKPDGTPNGPMMHTGEFMTLDQLITHYQNITIAPGNTNLDPRLTPGGMGQQLQITANERSALIAFLKTLSGTKVYTEAKWSNPFPN